KDGEVWDKMLTQSRDLRMTVDSMILESTVDPLDKDDILQEPVIPPESKDKPKDKDSNISIVSRADFVGEYQGFTATKTYNLLKNNLQQGKVTFIDEAYSLIHGDNDGFGMEALTTLNRFMSDHPEAIV